MNNSHRLLLPLLLTVLAGCANAAPSQQPTAPAVIVAQQPTAWPAPPTAAPGPSAVPTRAWSPTTPPTAVLSPVPSPTLSPDVLATMAAGSCAVTIANGNAPPGESTFPYIHGNGALWTGLWPDGVVRTTPDDVQSDGSIDIKFWWWRGVTGKLTITGRRLDGVAPPLQARIPDGYGDTGFQSTALIFPTEGCWEVTGRAGNATLTFVTYVVKEQG